MAVVYNVPIVAVDTYCCTCLSTGRKLSPFARIPLLADWQNIGLNHLNGFICWECRSMFMKILRFRTQVITASQWIGDSASIQSLSKLGKMVNEVIQCTIENTPTICEVEIKLEQVKEEPVDHADFEDNQTHSVANVNTFNEENSNCKADPTVQNNLNSQKSNINIDSKNHLNELKLTQVSLLDTEPRRFEQLAFQEFNIHPTHTEIVMKSKYTKIQIEMEELQQYYEAQRKFNSRSSSKVDCYKCAPCLITFDNAATLERHQKEFHDEQNQSVCDLCSCRFEDQSVLDEHTSLHNSIYKCNVCKYRHVQESLMINHINKQHYKESYVCKICNAVFSSRWKKDTHCTTHKGKIEVECEICRKVILKQSVKSHMRVHAAPESHHCHICEKTYTSAKNLAVHNKNMHKDKKQYYCAECNVSFGSNQLYQIHMTKTRRHNKYDFECTICKKTFLTELKLQRHTEAVHLRMNLFTCDLCEMSYCRKYELIKHITKKHDQTYKGPARDKVCDICGEAFTTMKILSVHYLRHTGEKPYKCDVCGTDFRHLSSLYTHNKLVHLKLKRNLKKKTAAKSSKQSTEEQTD